MTDPFAPAVWRSTPPVQSERDRFLQRLRRLGATPDEVQAVADGWDDFDDSWDRQKRERFIRLNDAQLAREIAKSREEYEHDTTTEEEALADEGRRAGALADAARLAVQGTVGSVLEWVRGDPERAEAVLGLEASAEGRGRATLVKALRAVVGG